MAKTLRRGPGGKLCRVNGKLARVGVPPDVGFDGTNIYGCVLTTYGDTVNYVNELADNIAQLDPCRLVFCRPYQTFPGAFFTISQASAISSWVTAGGRLVVVAEGAGMGDFARLNTFLSDIGSAMQFVANTKDLGCQETGDTNQATNLMQGFSGFMHGAVLPVTGGTWLAKTSDSPHSPWMAIEAIGDGWIVAAGDSSTWLGSGAISCACVANTQMFLTRLLDFNAALP